MELLVSSFLLFLFHRMFSITDMKSKGEGDKAKGATSWMQSNEAQQFQVFFFFYRKYPPALSHVSYYLQYASLQIGG
jgi:hypothetical protein